MDDDDATPRPDDTGPAATFRPVTGWSALWRGAFGTHHAGSHWVVDVHYLDLDERLRLYRDGRLVEERRSPARFALDDGASVRVALSTFGVRHAHLETAAGRRDLDPLPGTSEAWRDRMDREHPTASRAVAAVAWLVLVVGLLAQVPPALRLVEVALAHVDVAWRAPALWEAPDAWGPWLGGAAVLAAVDRALRRRWTPWLDD
ncbi:MAG: hypothetical protein J7503_13110 [Cellulomonas iranensis]|jgi:hypothetical protein|uniref:hypothetical protein n=1 Tax=Cellulomonas iranensis TaxID=76862 RepID=UPI001B16F08D|nr:hypothetical protein [Cellulomonas iranensis]MBO9569749.1 hypothetical protein [Cellulomonas iranensis]